MLGKLPVPGRPTYLDYSRARAYCACSKRGWGLLGHFFSLMYHFFSFSGKPKKTNQPNYICWFWLVGCFGFNGSLSRLKFMINEMILIL